MRKYRVYLESSEHGTVEVEAETAAEAGNIAMGRKDVDWCGDPEFLAYEMVEIDEHGEELDGTRVCP